ncbi:MAG: heat-inducible transcriptional repressor HrcA [Acidimicrobiia bacterium]
MLDNRRSRVLKALVEEYIRTGEPVSSQSVLTRSGLDVSSATVRNDLARLESYGFVAQPHTSSGRVPTHQGYRFYVDHLAPSKLREATRHRIDSFFHDVHRQVSDLLRETSTFVSDLTTYPSVVVGPVRLNDTVREVRLIGIGGSVVLAVAVADDGRVHQEFVDVGVVPDRDTLESAERLIAAAYEGRSLDDPAKDKLQVSEVSAVVRRVITPVTSKLATAGDQHREVYVGGTAQMVSLWNDLTMVQRLLELIDQQASLVDLVSDDAGGTQVRFGPDVGDVDDLAVVSTTYEMASGATGQIGVIGPMRMNYRRTIRVVEKVSESLKGQLGADE